MGLSWFVSLGDKSDVSGNDLLQFWEDDETTRVIAMYTESFGNPRKFARIARRVSRTPPDRRRAHRRRGDRPDGWRAVPAGRADRGADGAPPMLDTARVLATQPVMRGPRVAVIANARSPETLSRAALTTAGLEPVDSPVPLDWRSTPDDYGAAVRGGARRRRRRRPCSSSTPRRSPTPSPPRSTRSRRPPPGRPSRSSSCPSAASTGRCGRARRSRRSPSPSPPPPSSAAPTPTAPGWTPRPRADVAEAGDIDRAAAAGDDRRRARPRAPTLDVAEVVTVLAAYGVAMPETGAARRPTPSTMAAAIGYPVAVKAEHRHLGRSVRAGVGLDLGGADDVAAAVKEMQEAIGADADVVARPVDGPARARPAHPQRRRRPARPARSPSGSAARPPTS